MSAQASPDFFGSYPSGRADLLTDLDALLDALIVMDNAKSFAEKMTETHRLLALPVDADILCYTPQEFEMIEEIPFLRRTLTDEVVFVGGLHGSDCRTCRQPSC